MSSLQTYDWIMLGVIAVAVLFGAWKGLAWQVASIAAIFVSYLVALRLHAPVAAWIRVDPPWNSFLAMFLIYAGCSLVIWIAFGFVRTFIDRFHLKSFDRQVGALIGGVKGGALCIVITLFAVTLLGPTKRQEICQSRSGQLIARTINRLRGLVPEEVHEVLAPYLKKFDDAMARTGTAGSPGTGENLGGIWSGQPAPAAAGDAFAGNLAEQFRSAAQHYFGAVSPTAGETAGTELEGVIRQ